MPTETITVRLTADGSLEMSSPSGTRWTPLPIHAAGIILRRVLEARLAGHRTIGSEGDPTAAEVLIQAFGPPSRRLDTRGHDKNITLEDLGL